MRLWASYCCQALDHSTGGFYLFAAFAGKKREPASGLEPLTCSLRVRCSPSGCDRRSTKPNCGLIPANASTEAEVSGLMVCESTRPCRKTHRASLLSFRHAPAAVAELHPESARHGSLNHDFCSFAWMSAHPCRSPNVLSGLSTLPPISTARYRPRSARRGTANRSVFVFAGRRAPITLREHSGHRTLSNG